jgi:hypothetical protein
MKYHIKFDGNFVKEKGFEYLIECKKEDSIFSETMAKAIKKQCPSRVQLIRIKEVNNDRNME